MSNEVNRDRGFQDCWKCNSAVPFAIKVKRIGRETHTLNNDKM